MNDWHQTAQPPAPARRRTSLRSVLALVASAMIVWVCILGIGAVVQRAADNRRQLVEIRVDMLRQSIRDVDLRTEASADWRYRQHQKIYKQISSIYTQAGYDDMAERYRVRARDAETQARIARHYNR